MSWCAAATATCSSNVGQFFSAAAEVGTVQADGPCMIFESRAPTWLAFIPNEESIESLFVLARHKEPMICRHTLE